MVSEESLTEEIRKSLIVECSEDDVGLWFFIWQFREVALEKSVSRRREKTLGLVKQLLEEGLIQAGGTNPSNGQFQAWELSTDEIIDWIEEEWNDLNREPDIGEIVWFIATESRLSQS